MKNTTAAFLISALAVSSQVSAQQEVIKEPEVRGAFLMNEARSNNARSANDETSVDQLDFSNSQGPNESEYSSVGKSKISPNHLHLAYEHILNPEPECLSSEPGVSCTQSASPNKENANAAIDAAVVKIETGTESYLAHIDANNLREAFEKADTLLVAMDGAKTMDIHFVEAGHEVYSASCNIGTAATEDNSALACKWEPKF